MTSSSCYLCGLSEPRPICRTNSASSFQSTFLSRQVIPPQNRWNAEQRLDHLPNVDQLTKYNTIKPSPRSSAAQYFCLVCAIGGVASATLSASKTRHASQLIKIAYRSQPIWNLHLPFPYLPRILGSQRHLIQLSLFIFLAATIFRSCSGGDVAWRYPSVTWNKLWHLPTLHCQRRSGFQSARVHVLTSGV